jgi:hypothetical protein
MFKRKRYIRGLLLLVLAVIPLSPVGARAGRAPIGEVPVPLPDDCIGVAPADPDACCLYGYIYNDALAPDSAPVTGVTLHIESAHGMLDQATGSGPDSDAPYYTAHLNAAPLLAAPGDPITITATYRDMRSARTWTVQPGSQHVDLGLVSGYQAP